MATLNQGIQDFYRVAQQRDFSRDFQLRVMDITDHGTPQLSQDDLVYVRTAKLPGRSITPAPVPYMGLEFTVPGAAKYPGSAEYALEFYADEELVVRNTIYNWTVRTFSDDTSGGNYGISDASRMTLALLDMQDNVTQTFVLHGVYPVLVGEIQYDMTGDGKAVVLPVTIAYQFWRPGLAAPISGGGLLSKIFGI